MSTYRIDPLHPDCLVCEVCGDAVAAVPPALAPHLPAGEGLTRRLGLCYCFIVGSRKSTNA
jgi:hypothetical protein